MSKLIMSAPKMANLIEQKRKIFMKHLPYKNIISRLCEEHQQTNKENRKPNRKISKTLQQTIPMKICPIA